MAANLYLVFVEVRYTKLGFDAVERFWPVRIVAFDAETAERGALDWAQLQREPTMIDGVVAFARQTLHTEFLCRVDCIAENVVDGRRAAVVNSRYSDMRMRGGSMRIGWLCKYGGVSGEIESPATSTLQELRNTVKADHAKVCKIGGHTWILIDAEGKGRIEPDGCSVSIDISVKAYDYFVLLHVQ